MEKENEGEKERGSDGTHSTFYILWPLAKAGTACPDVKSGAKDIALNIDHLAV